MWFKLSINSRCLYSLLPCADLDFFEYDDKDSDVGPPQNLVQQEWDEVREMNCLKKTECCKVIPQKLVGIQIYQYSTEMKAR